MAENLPDPGGGPPQSSQLEDWKFITNNSRIVVLPDPRINALINSDCVSDDQSSNGNSDHVHGEGLDELEYDHEPGIALHQLEFGRPCTTDDILEEYAPIQHRARCPQCGVDYESGKILRIFLFLTTRPKLADVYWPKSSGLLDV